MPIRIHYIFYGLFFLILSEHLNWQTLIAAVFSIILTELFLTAPQRTSALRGHMIPAIAGLWLLFGWTLLREILYSNLQVARIVLTPRMPINPTVACYTTRLKNPLLQAVFCNAITLTPGTMTIAISEGTLKIHCLTTAYAQSLGQNPVEPILARIEEVLNG